MFLLLREKLQPQVEKFEAVLQHDVPVRNCHLQIQTFLPLVSCKVEGEQVEFLELRAIAEFRLQLWEAAFQCVQGVAAEVSHSFGELFTCELALHLWGEESRIYIEDNEMPVIYYLENFIRDILTMVLYFQETSTNNCVKHVVLSGAA